MTISVNNGYVLIHHFGEDIMMAIFSAVLAISVATLDFKLMFTSTFKVHRRMMATHKQLINYVRQEKTLDSNMTELM